MRTLFAILLTAAACGNDLETPGDDDVAPDASPDPDGYATLVAGDWSLAPSSEKYVCVRLTATSDLYIRSIRPVAPLGTHHTVLMIGAPDGPDGTVDCTSALVKPAIFASGVGTDTLDLPAGVAVHVRPGQQLLLNLHLFNGSDADLTGTSGIEVLEAEPEAVQHEAGVVLIGKAQGLEVPPNMSTQVGRCTTPANVTVFAVAPHMHMMGRHMKVSYANADGTGARVLHDQPYDFDEQRFGVLAPHLVTGAGARVTVECTYFNPTGQTVYFGESSNQEMCYALAFIHPPPPPSVQQCVQ
jgi:hypothetical protein